MAITRQQAAEGSGKLRVQTPFGPGILKGQTPEQHRHDQVTVELDGGGEVTVYLQHCDVLSERTTLVRELIEAADQAAEWSRNAGGNTLELRELRLAVEYVTRALKIIYGDLKSYRWPATAPGQGPISTRDLGVKVLVHKHEWDKEIWANGIGTAYCRCGDLRPLIKEEDA